MPASFSAAASRARTSRTALPTTRTASNIVFAFHTLSSCGPVRSQTICRTACVMARLPADSSTISRSPGCSNTVILRKVEIWSTPALVRESARNTSPASSRMATQ